MRVSKQMARMKINDQIMYSILLVSYEQFLQFVVYYVIERLHMAILWSLFQLPSFCDQVMVDGCDIG